MFTAASIRAASPPASRRLSICSRSLTPVRTAVYTAKPAQENCKVISNCNINNEYDRALSKHAVAFLAKIWQNVGNIMAEIWHRKK